MGRHKKEEYLTEDDHLAAIFAQLFDAELDEATGEVKYVRSGRRLSLEDMAFLTWIQDGKPGKGPITKVGQLKREAKVLQKIKFKLLKSGYTLEDIHELIAMLSKTQRQAAKCCDRVEGVTGRGYGEDD